MAVPRKWAGSAPPALRRVGKGLRRGTGDLDGNGRDSRTAADEAGIGVHIDLSSKTALVTGSTQGIGAAIAAGLAGAGARVAVNGRGSKSVEAAIARLGAARGGGGGWAPRGQGGVHRDQPPAHPPHGGVGL
ncbi:SDR family NAD(P)-dependent oxidoreductase, partial [Streptomyces sp. NPDC059552]|uniref:SDR family NAD(P)-dependent oxidoreductase n=1 Tax=Streptomyces sp. NPDC059552 TaxID=3346862 RepID=UPI00369B6CC0